MRKEKLIKKINPAFLKGIAHRGLWNDKYTENGIPAFTNAINHNLAFELDVHITLDNVLIVCHDDDLKRTTGKPGIIEDLTSEEIRTNYKLLDGTNVPTLQEVLKLNKEKVPMVIELKVRKRNYRKLAKLVKQEMKAIINPSNFFYISFDPRALKCLGKTKIVQGLLTTPQDGHGWVYKLRYMFDSCDIDKLFIDDKRTKRYGKRHFLNVWTIETKEEFDKVLPYVDTVTFQKMDHNYVVDHLTQKNFY